MELLCLENLTAKTAYHKSIFLFRSASEEKYFDILRPEKPSDRKNRL